MDKKSNNAGQEEANELLARVIQESKKESPAEAYKRREKVCKKCDYWSVNMCDYFLREKQLKPCAGKDCVKMGIYKKKKKGRKTVEENWD